MAQFRISDKRKRLRPFIPQRRRVFLGCEGESEQSYGTLLGKLLASKCPDWHIHPVLLQPGGGDPLAIVELARKRIAEEERKRETPYIIRAVLLDSDKLGQTPERDAQIQVIAASISLRLIWQHPCHEAILLRHLDRCQNLKPPTSDLAMNELKKYWPEYTKGLSALRLADRIREEEIKRVIKVETDLAAFIADIGFN